MPSGHVTTYSEIAKRHRRAARGPGGRHRGRTQSDQPADPLPPGAAEIGRAGGVSLGACRSKRAMLAHEAAMDEAATPARAATG